MEEMAAGTILTLKDPKEIENVILKSFSEKEGLRIIDPNQGMLLKPEAFNSNPLEFIVLTSNPIWITYNTNESGPENVRVGQMVYNIDNASSFNVVERQLDIRTWKRLPFLALLMIATEELSIKLFCQPQTRPNLFLTREERFLYNLVRSIINRKKCPNRAFRRLVYFISTRNILLTCREDYLWLMKRLTNQKKPSNMWGNSPNFANTTINTNLYYTTTTST